MKTRGFLFLSFVAVYLFFSCEKNEDIDIEKPSIDIGSLDAFPKNCDTIYFGESFDLKAFFSDNVELGSFSIGIHHNFDHHSHDTEVTDCEQDPKKEPVNPITYINDFSIPAKSKEYQTNQSILIPAGNDTGLFDEGDYHFFISLTDYEGWSTPKGLSIKMLHR